MDWFLIRKNEHLGPFTEKVLKQMYSEGELQAESLIWREGLSASQSYQDVFLDKSSLKKMNTTISSDDLPPDLPPLPIEDEEVEVEQATVEQATVEQLKDEGNEEAVFHIDEIDEPGLYEEIEEEEDEIRQEAKLKTPATPKYRKKLRYLLFAVLLILGSVFAFLYYQQKTQIFTRPKLMSLRDFERLKKTALSDPSQMRFAFAMGKAKKSFWVATNSPLMGEVAISLKSIKGKMLGEPVEIKAYGNLANKLITINKFEFISGTKFVDGVYAAQITTVGKLKSPLYARIFDPSNKKIHFAKHVLISNLAKKDFQKLLARYLKKKQSNSRLFWEELIQKYQTVKMITGEIKSGIMAIFDKDPLKWAQNVLAFENEYKTRYGIFFTEFVKTNEASYAKLMKKDFENNQEVLANYNHLSNLATDIGERSMAILEALQAYDPDKNTPAQRKALKQESASKLDEIIKGCDEKIQELSNS